MSSCSPTRRVHRTVAAALGAAAIVGAVPATGAAAPAPVSFTFLGRGDGHGVGMSQYGAEGAARAGWSAARILAWFYRGTHLGRVADPTIRVEVAAGAAMVRVGVDGAGGVLVDAAGRRHPLRAGVGYTVRTAAGGRLLVTAGGRPVGAPTVALRIAPGTGGRVVVASRDYRGTLSLSAAGGIRVINVLPLEEYLRGVVTSEMPASWHAAALAAQAIAARSYAARARAANRPFDVYADTRSQAYGGVAAESPSGDRAVATTAGQVVMFGTGIADTYFAASDGGYTESVQNVWGGPAIAYLVGVPDPFDALAPEHVWSAPPRFTGARLGELLGTGGVVSGIAVLRRGVSPRVIAAQVQLTSGRRVVLGGARIASDLGLPSTWFWVWQSNRPRPDAPAVASGGGVVPATPQTGAGTPSVPSASTGDLVPSGAASSPPGVPPAP